MANALNVPNAAMRNLAADSKKGEASVIPFEWKDATTMLKEHEAARSLKAKSAYDGADWYYAPGAFYFGVYEGVGAYPYGIMLVPYMDSVMFYNYYGATDWSVNGKLDAENTDEYVATYGINGDYNLPVTAVHEFNPSKDWDPEYKDTTLNMKGTLSGNGSTDSWLSSAIEAKCINGENMFMTLCAMYTDSLLEDGGNDFWRVSGAFAGDPYFNGTGVHINGSATTADTLGILVDNRGLMKIEQILFAVYADNKAAANGVIPDGAEVRVALFPLDEDGIHFDDTIASTVITNADIIGGAASWGYYGTLHAKFYEKDIFGTETQVPVWVDGSFYLQLTNFNETGCDFGFFSDYDCPTTGTTVYQHDGKFSYRGHTKTGGGSFGQNLGISFDAYFPTLINDTTVNKLNAPVEGGPAYFGEDTEDHWALLWSNVNPDEWEIEAEDWSEVAGDNQYFEEYNAMYIEFNCEALPEGQLGRECTVVINADGAKIEFTIKQGTIYTVAGGLSDEGDIDDPVFGKSWNTDLVENNLEQDGEILVWEKEDLELTAGQKIMFKVVKDHAWDEAWPAENYEVSVEEDGQYKLTITFNPEDNSVNATLVNTTPVVYTVAGGLSDEGNIDDPVFGKSWNPELSDNDMVLEEDLYVWKKENLELTAGQKIQFKVVKNHSWDKAWPESNYEVSIAKDGIYALTITFKEDEEKVDAILVKVPDYPDLADGYYLVGTFNDWTPTAEDLLVLNEGAEGEYTIIVDLNEGDEFKAVRIEGGDIVQWYPEGMGNNYVVDADHAGHKTVYFRPAGSEEWGGDFWIDMYEGFEQISADGKPVKVIYNGEMLIIRGDKIFNAQGATVK